MNSCVCCFRHSSSTWVTRFWLISFLVFKVMSSSLDLCSTTNVFWKRLFLLGCCDGRSEDPSGLHNADCATSCAWLSDAGEAGAEDAGAQPRAFDLGMAMRWNPWTAAAFRPDTSCQRKLHEGLKTSGPWRQSPEGKELTWFGGVSVPLAQSRFCLLVSSLPSRPLLYDWELSLHRSSRRAGDEKSPLSFP